MSTIVKETTEQFSYGIKSVSDTASQLTSVKLGQGNYKGLLLKAPGVNDDDPNSLSVFIGTLGVTADQGARGGFPLAPGESIVLPLQDAEFIYVIAADANQKVNWILM